MLEETSMSIKYEPDPRKLAISCHYDLEQIEETINQVKVYGAGCHMTDDQILQLKILAIEESSLARNNWTFKRMIVTFNIGEIDYN